MVCPSLTLVSRNALLLRDHFVMNSIQECYFKQIFGGNNTAISCFMEEVLLGRQDWYCLDHPQNVVFSPHYTSLYWMWSLQLAVLWSKSGSLG